MAAIEDVVIVGAGLAGLATAVGLHRKGIKSLVLETSDSLRASGFAFMTWTNAWRSLDALGVADSLRRQYPSLQRAITYSASSGAVASNLSLTGRGKCGQNEARCVRRNILLETLARELPQGTIRFSSKVVAIDDEADGGVKLLHLADGCTLKAKVIVGCDGVNSAVARWLGFDKPSFSGRWASRGFVVFPDGHGFENDMVQYNGKGFRFGTLPCNDKSVYWFFTWTPTAQEREIEENGMKLKQFVVNKLKTSKVPEELVRVVEMSETSSVLASPLRFRSPLELVRGNISKGNVCVAGDALHAMTPDLGQGGCAALEDGVVLARCLGDALLDGGGKGEREKVEAALNEFAKQRRWRGIALIVVGYVLGRIQESNGAMMDFMRDKALAWTMNLNLKMADFDLGGL